jgi:membrane-associated protease RseP (regulator of RpoE activity)
VEKFFLFFDIGDNGKIFSTKGRFFTRLFPKAKDWETEYGIGWLPLGGYCKISGMIDESMDTEAMKKDPQPWEFRTKPAWQRLLVMIGGVLYNFIFAIICEEFGMVGGTIVILLYAWIVYRGMRVAMKCRNRYGSLMAAGISIVFGLQVFINIAVVTGLAPTTGQPLPFISAGGSSLLVFMVSMGILLNISRDVDI